MSKLICACIGVLAGSCIGLSQVSYADSVKHGVSLCLYGDCHYRKISHEIGEPQENPKEKSKSISTEKKEEKVDSKKGARQKPRLAKARRTKESNILNAPAMAIAHSDENPVRTYPKVGGNLPTYY